jgi:hypothetical protein
MSWIIFCPIDYWLANFWAGNSSLVDRRHVGFLVQVVSRQAFLAVTQSSLHSIIQDALRACRLFQNIAINIGDLILSLVEFSVFCWSLPSRTPGKHWIVKYITTAVKLAVNTGKFTILSIVP